MTPRAFSPKVYQSQVLESLERYFDACHEFDSAALAFGAVTERLWGRPLAYHPLAGFPPDMPYCCLRVPTGGGKDRLDALRPDVKRTQESGKTGLPALMLTA
jgi:type III restriction enzyme